MSEELTEEERELRRLRAASGSVYDDLGVNEEASTTFRIS